ncbi:MAG: LCP family protein [Ruminococcus sp.]|nr:LCP family protein [Ruminococcus sp.]
MEDYFQIEIDRYVRVSFQEFITVVDTIGGIDMKVSDEEAIGMHDPMAEQNNYLGNARETDWLWEGGDLHLNGNQALAYARLRYVGNSDWERTERQRKVLKEVITKGRELSLLKINSLLNEVLPNVHTDLTDGEIASLLVDVFDILDYDVQEVRIPADGYYSNEIVDNMDVLLFNYNANAAIIQKVVYGDCKTVEEAIAEYQEETGDFYAYNTTYDPSYNPNYNNTNW